jgi:hypothetical protein
VTPGTRGCVGVETAWPTLSAPCPGAAPADRVGRPGDQEDPGENDQEEERFVALPLGVGGDGLPGGERRGAGGRDLHQLRAHQQAAADGRGDAGVEPVHPG